MSKRLNNNSHRLSRVNELIKRELSSLLQGMDWIEQGIEGLNLKIGRAHVCLQSDVCSSDL